MNQKKLIGATTSPSKMLIAVLVLLNAVAPFSIDMYLAAFPQLAQALLGFLQYGAGALTPPLVGIAGHSSAVPMAIVMLAALTALLLLTRGPAPCYEHLDKTLPALALNMNNRNSPRCAEHT
jgi:hypothetical protein